MSGNPQWLGWRGGMSRSALGVTSDILGLKILVRDAMQALQSGDDLPSIKRNSLSEYFHQYITTNHVHRLKASGVSKLRNNLQNVAATVVMLEAAGNGPKLLAAIEKFASYGSKIDERELLVDYFSRVNSQLERRRAGIPVNRYL